MRSYAPGFIFTTAASRFALPRKVVLPSQVDAVDAVAIKTKIAAATAIVYTPAAIVSTAACISAVIDGVGIIACGPAVKDSLSVTAAWTAWTSFAGDVATLKANAQVEIQKNKAAIAAVTQQLDATKAKNIKDNYSNPLRCHLSRRERAVLVI